MNETQSVSLIIPDKYGISEENSNVIAKNCIPIIQEFNKLEIEYDLIMNEKEMSAELAKSSKSLRNKYVKVRTGGDKVIQSAKDEVQKQVEAHNQLRRDFKEEITSREDKLREKELYFEKIEADRLEKIRQKRNAELEKYETVYDAGDVALLDDVLYGHFLNGVKADFEEKKEAEKKAEAERIAKEKAAIAEQNRIKAENERLKKEAEEKEKKAKAEREKLEKEYRSKLENRRLEAIDFLKKYGFKNAHGGMEAIDYPHFIGALHYSELTTDNELKLFKQGVLSTKEKEEKSIADEKAENERKRLAEIEQDKRDKLERVRLAVLAAERKQREAKEAKAKEEHEAELRKEREEKARIQKELEAKAEAERKRKRAEQIAIIKAEEEAKAKAEQNRLLELAPVKDKLKRWINETEISDPTNKDMDKETFEMVEDIMVKFNKFKTWAKGEIEKIK